MLNIAEYRTKYKNTYTFASEKTNDPALSKVLVLLGSMFLLEDSSPDLSQFLEIHLDILIRARRKTFFLIAIYFVGLKFFRIEAFPCAGI